MRLFLSINCYTVMKSLLRGYEVTLLLRGYEVTILLSGYGVTNLLLL